MITEMIPKNKIRITENVFSLNVNGIILKPMQRRKFSNDMPGRERIKIIPML